MSIHRLCTPSRLALALALVVALPPAARAAEPGTEATGERILVLNRATPEQLASLDEVDADEAEAVVAFIHERGSSFKSVEELRAMPGMDGPTLDSIRDRTAVEVQLASGTGRTFKTAEEVLAEFDHEPTAMQVQTWASDYARLNPEQVDRWLSASKSFALLPELTVEGRLDGGWDQDFVYYPTDGTVDQPDESVFAVLDDAGKDGTQRMLVRMKWQLDKLVMSSERIRVISEAQDIVKLRDKVMTEVTRLYFERRRVQVEMMLTPKSDLMGQVKDQLRLMELTANLDALSGGAFTRALLK